MTPAYKEYIRFRDRQLKELSWELDGVIIDIEDGDGFDEVCLNTIKRVQASLCEHSTPPKINFKSGIKLIQKLLQ